MVHQEHLTLWFTELASPYDIHSALVKSYLFMGRTAFREVIILDTHEASIMASATPAAAGLRQKHLNTEGTACSSI